VRDKQRIELVLHELPKDGSSVYTIAGSESRAPLFSIFGKSLPIDFWKNLKIDKEICWEWLAENVDSDRSVIAEKGEKMLHQWKGNRLMQVVQGSTTRTTTTERGALLLSNRKLLWIATREKGLWKKTTSSIVAYEIPLDEIKGVTGETGDSNDWHEVLKKISIVDCRGENTFYLKYAFLELFRPILEGAIDIRRKEIEREKRDFMSCWTSLF
jgi:hypothetical protein